MALSLAGTAFVSAPAVRAADPVAELDVLAWGQNQFGQLSTSTDTGGWATPGPPTAGLPKNIVAVAAGAFHAMALTSSGEVWTWGRNDKGQLGDGTTNSRPTPQKVAGLGAVSAIEGGGSSSFAVKSDGSIMAWGANDLGQLGDGTTTGRSSPAPVVAAGGQFVSVALGADVHNGRHALALTAGGAVWSWGDNQWGQLGDGTTMNRPQPQLISGFTSVREVAAGAQHSIVVKSDGTVWAWGKNSEGELGRGHRSNGPEERQPRAVVELGDVKTLAAAQSYSLAVKNDGSVVRWGFGPDSEDPPGSKPVAVSGLSNIIDVAAGGEHSLARKGDGSVWAWGRNSFFSDGQRVGVLGTGSPELTSRPEPVIGLGAGATAFDAGIRFSLATQTPQPVPEVPGAPVVSALAGLNRTMVSWRVVDAGRRPVDQFRVTALGEDGSPALGEDGTPLEPVVTAGTQQRTNVTGLVNGRSYRFAVTATNSVGTGPAGMSAFAVPGTGVEYVYEEADPATPGANGPEGTTVWIRGSGFTGTTNVTFGGTPATIIETSPEQLRVVAPVHAPGPVDVIVASPTGTSVPHPAARFVYDPPKLISLAPSSAPSRGGTEVTISGKSFLNVTGVKFGDVPATFFRTVSSTEITVGSPPQLPDGPVRVTVTTAGGPAVATSVRADRFLYLDGDWSPGGSLRWGRVGGHTVTLLDKGACAPRCGMVLVAGGGQSIGDTLDFEPSRGVAQPELYDRAAGTWSETGTMTVGRFGHTATVLASGKVLVTGGISEIIESPGCGLPFVACVVSRSILASAELYNPADGTWTATREPMSSPRHRHAASLLTDGRVLVSGGHNCTANPCNDVLSSAEIYDPETDTWSDMPAMSFPRKDHTATTLADGTVLVVGGNGLPATTASTARSAELFAPSPTGGAWRPTGSMTSGYAGHTATLQSPSSAGAPSRVLAVGGSAVTPELYDPTLAGRDILGNVVAGGWTPIFPMERQWIISPNGSQPVKGHTTTVLDGGKVLVAGGNPPTTPGTAGAQAEIYLPASDAWFSVAPMVHPRLGAEALLLPATAEHTSALLVVGGVGNQSDDAAPWSAERLSIDSGRPPAILSLDPPVGLSGQETTVTIAGFGLFPGASVTIGARQARIVEETYTRLLVVAPPLGQGIADIKVTTPNGSSAPERFTYGAGAWAPTGSFKGVTTFPAAPPSPYPQYGDSAARQSAKRYHHGAVLLDPPECHGAPPVIPGPPLPSQEYPCGKVLVVGGTDNHFAGKAHALTELYDPATGTWTVKTPMRDGGRFDFTATLLANGNVLVAGGRYDNVSVPARRTAEVYDPRTDQWTPTVPMSAERHSHSATLLRDGRVLVAGGSTVEGERNALSSTELFDPLANSWTPAPPMDVARQLHTATLLPDGGVLVAGGLIQSLPVQHSVTNSAEVFRIVGPGSPPGAPPAVPGYWTTVGSLASARFSHTATVLDRAPCGDRCGMVLFVGGYAADQRGGTLTSAEIFDPASGSFAAARQPATARGGHSSTLLGDGTVLVAGHGYPFPGLAEPATAGAELFDPVDGRWAHTNAMRTERGLHTSTLLDGPACRVATPPAYCHSVLVAGGTPGGDDATEMFGLDTAELYRPVPRTTALLPAAGPRLGGTEVAITGTGFEPTSTVSFGEIPAQSVIFESPTRLRAVTPPHARGKVEVAVTNQSGTSGHIVPRLDVPFTFETTSVPDQVTSLVASPTSSSLVTLSFAAPADDAQFPSDSPPAKLYMVKQSQARFTDAESFAAATSICPVGGCEFVPPRVGSELILEVKDLEPATTYHYAVAAVNDIGQGPVSLPATATTLAAPPFPLPIGCAALPPAEPGQIAYPASRYSLVGLPGGTQVPADSPLYSWLDLGAGGNYSAASAPVTAGHGYWAWFKCPKVVDLAPGTASVRLPLGAYHASMVGNPSTSPATITGHDFAARWDPSLNDGSGGYRISGYRDPQPLDVGEGSWVFSYVRTEIRIGG